MFKNLKDLLDSYAHDYRDMKMSETQLRVMLGDVIIDYLELKDKETVSPSLNQAVNELCRQDKIKDVILNGFPKEAQ